MSDLSPFDRELLFPGSRWPGGKVWVRYEAAIAAIDFAKQRCLPLVGLEGFVVGENVYPSLSRVAGFSRPHHQVSPCDDAKGTTERFVGQPRRPAQRSKGVYMIDAVLDD
jgi:hypothetical protein